MDLLSVKKNSLLKLFTLILLLAVQLPLSAQVITIDDSGSSADNGNYRHITREKIPTGEKFINFGIVYTAQWGIYIVNQFNTVREEGSFHNWHTNMFNLDMDKDSYDFNVIKHSMAGNYYYNFYRSRGYSKPESLGWSFASSLMFEFTIETVTEVPSAQDIYQTPVLGAIAGIAIEALAIELVNSKVKPLQVLGYILNPFMLLPCSYYEWQTIPIVSHNFQGLGLSLRF